MGMPVDTWRSVATLQLYDYPQNSNNEHGEEFRPKNDERVITCVCSRVMLR